jgi:hypothetical protein
MLRFVRAAVCAGIALAASNAAFAQDGDVLAPARQGQMQCFVPDAARKTCQSIGAYVFEANGVIQNTADVLIVPEPAIVMRITAPVTVRDNAVCGPLTLDDVNHAQFTISGRPASDEETQQIRAEVAQQLAPLINVETCVGVRTVDGALRAETALNGVLRPDLSQPIIWVRPEDGYRVAP